MRRCICIGLWFLFLTSCANLHHIDTLPKGSYTISSDYLAENLPVADLEYGKISKIRKVLVEQSDSILTLTSLNESLPPIKVSLNRLKKFRLHRHTFDIDILTIPFKIRPSVMGFPEQLNANFSAALYLGRRRDIYHINSDLKNSKLYTKITGVGLGYGGFIGLGGVTMNPFVTQGKISYEYDGLVLNSGVAAIYDAKKFNIGIALGTDFLVDKNRKSWIYQQKPWFGVLLGINLN